MRQARATADAWEKRARQLQQKYGKVDLEEHQHLQAELAAARERADGLVDAVLDEQRATLDATIALAARGLDPHAEWVRDGFVAEQQGRIAWTERNRHLFD